jgi:predicted nucleic acid-binding protein
MREVFVDTLYFVARLNPKDQWHKATDEVAPLLGMAHLVTTEQVLTETLNFFASYPAEMKQTAANVVRNIWAGNLVEVIQHTEGTFLSGLELYESRPDKGYSLTDCISMSAMRERQITDVLTHDNHFRQEGFNVLL